MTMEWAPEAVSGRLVHDAAGLPGNPLRGSGHMRTRIVLLLLTLVSRSVVSAADYPAPVEGDVTLCDFRFASGETLPAVRLHYRTLGTPQRDERGVVRNAVLILHGTGGEGGSL